MRSDDLLLLRKFRHAIKEPRSPSTHGITFPFTKEEQPAIKRLIERGLIERFAMTDAKFTQDGFNFVRELHRTER